MKAVSIFIILMKRKASILYFMVRTNNVLMRGTETEI
jgi:hypothetical protein